MREGKKVINIAIVGDDPIGNCVYHLIERKQETILNRTGCELNVRAVCAREPEKLYEGILPEQVEPDFDRLLTEETIDTIVDVTKDVHPARENILRALKAGKHVVTANKNVIASCGQELAEAALAARRALKFEAAVADGVPMAGLLADMLVPDDIDQVVGIVSKTENRILSNMTETVAATECVDSAAACAILASVAFRSWVKTQDVMYVGINRITPADICYAKEIGYVIRHLAVAKETDGEVVASVYPALIPENHPLASVNDNCPALYVRSDIAGETLLCGHGNREFSVAGAVLSDLTRIASCVDDGSEAGNLCYRKLGFKPQSEISNQFFLRLKVEDKPGVLAAIANVFGVNHVSIKQLLQKSLGSNEAELVIVTEKVREQNFRDALSVLAEMDRIRAVSNVLRVHGLK